MAMQSNTKTNVIDMRRDEMREVVEYIGINTQTLKYNTFTSFSFQSFNDKSNSNAGNGQCCSGLAAALRLT